MPRQVDHASRRRLIAEAVCRLADERGLEGVTLRDVAARAQVSMGAVQRCFRTKEEMLVFALTHIGERINERVQARLVRSPAQSAATALGHAVSEFSLLAEEHRAEARVWLAFVAQATVSEVLASTLATNYQALQETFTSLIAEAAESNDPAVPLDAQREARTLLALADGLTAHVLIGHLTPHEAHDILDAHLIGLWSVCRSGFPTPP
ncbi:TetR family transcriptional regulator C-terminal domain-containing protein [Streptomyces sp. SID3343]|uniref:TetR/AcrR family transcriptional regulator n=1 Tax=Streptomyces sp. SID3343 TaxID=2690260 RepID=UPI00136B2B58|nr:TetR family transcriptional regulator C-terminal domain-containing protein [Streptomyces sp. SID3343]MYV99092.1 TetR family transcriptional regulator [Streptomyces sp. SID3343]